MEKLTIKEIEEIYNKCGANPEAKLNHTIVSDFVIPNMIVTSINNSYDESKKVSK